jgi:hypothetical protein
VAPARDAFYSVAFQLTNLANVDPRLIGYGFLNMRP